MAKRVISTPFRPPVIEALERIARERDSYPSAIVREATVAWLRQRGDLPPVESVNDDTPDDSAAPVAAAS